MNFRDAIVGSLTITVIHSLAATVICLILGFFSAWGMFSLSKRWQRFSVPLLWLPNWTPTLFLILALFNIGGWFGVSPRGHSGVLLAHVLLNLGAATAGIFQLIKTKASGVVELALTEGASRLQIYRCLLLFLARDMGLIGFFLFSLYFTSFAIPWTLSLPKPSFLEVTLFEAIRIDHDWRLAVFLSLLQILTIFFFSRFMKLRSSDSKERDVNFQEISLSGFWVVALIPSLILVVGLVPRIPSWSTYVEELSLLQPILLRVVFGSLVIGLGVCFLNIFVFLILLKQGVSARVEKLLIGFSPPSAILIGFALLLCPGHSDFFVFAKLIFGLFFVTFPFVCKYVALSEIARMTSQRLVAESLGASSWSTLSEVLWPQARRGILFASALAAVWALGDFSVSSVLAPRDLSLSMLTLTYMSSYRLPIATTLIWILALISFLIILALTRGDYVDNKKSQS